MNPLDNWDTGAIFVDVPMGTHCRLHHVPIPCPWCDRSHFVVLEHAERSVRGRQFCDHCGEFFRFDVVNLQSRTRRSRARATTATLRG
jgi:hypothetical protein